MELGDMVPAGSLGPSLQRSNFLLIRNLIEKSHIFSLSSLNSNPISFKSSPPRKRHQLNPPKLISLTHYYSPTESNLPLLNKVLRTFTHTCFLTTPKQKPTNTNLQTTHSSLNMCDTFSF